MSDAEFVVSFIAEVVSVGGNPVETAKEEITSIDNILNESERLKIRRMGLVSVLDHLGDDTYKRRRNNSIPSSDDIDISSDDMKSLVVLILDKIEKSGPIMVGDLVRAVGGYDMDTLIMRAVKWLGEQEIVSRDDQGRVQKGKNWKKEL
jgi:hypothetical protein